MPLAPWWLTVNVVIFSIFPLLISVVTGCKLAKLGCNKFESRNTFFKYKTFLLHFVIFLIYTEQRKCQMHFLHLGVHYKALFLCYLMKNDFTSLWKNIFSTVFFVRVITFCCRYKITQPCPNLIELALDVSFVKEEPITGPGIYVVLVCSVTDCVPIPIP